MSLTIQTDIAEGMWKMFLPDIFCTAIPDVFEVYHA